MYISKILQVKQRTRFNPRKVVGPKTRTGYAMMQRATHAVVEEKLILKQSEERSW